MIEKWKSIEGFEDYQISNHGRVKSLKYNRSMILKNCSSRDGYTEIYLSDSNYKYTRLVHRLVAKAFIGPPPDGYETNHKDGNKKNNRIDNLEWVTKSDNAKHAFDNGLRTPPCLTGEDHPGAKLTNKDVYEIKRRLKMCVKQAVLANKYGVDQTTICNINTGKTWSHINA